MFPPRPDCRRQIVSLFLIALLLARPAGAIVTPEKEEVLLARALCGELLALAANQRAGTKAEFAPAEVVGVKGAAPEYTVEWRASGSGETKTAALPVGDFFFAPAAYAAWLAKVQPVTATAPQGRPPSAILKTLLTPTAANLRSENERLSKLLTSQPGNPDACEEAALLAAVTGLREAAGNYRDSRPAIRRTVIFLAYATALRPDAPRSQPGAMAELALDVICHRQTLALAAIEKWRKKGQLDSTVEAWLRALELQTRGDWRLLTAPKSRSLLEQIEYVRALAQNVGVDKGLEFLRAASPAPIADWPRLLLEESFGVEQGQVITAMALPSEIQELPAIAGELKDATAVKRFLNTRPAGPVAVAPDGRRKIEPIDQGMWAQFAQRHLLQVVSRTDYFLRHLLGAREQAEQFEMQTELLVGGLTLEAPLAVARSTEQDDYEGAMTAVAHWLAAEPLWLPPQQWAFLRRTRSPFKYVDVLPPTTDVFTPPSPTGTVLDPGGRINLKDVYPSVEVLEAWHRLSPYTPVITRNLAGKLKDNPVRVAEICAPIVEFNVPAMRLTADAARDNPTRYRALMQKVCELVPDDFSILGRYLADRGMTDDAAAAYQLYFDHGRDRVGVSNRIEWLVNYYFDRGQKEKALAVAKDAAAVYSFSGLETMAHLQERMGNLAEAEKSFEAIRERYENSGPLIAFYGRAREMPGGVEFGGKYDREMKAIFPNGIEKAEIGALPAPPAAGVLIRGNTDTLRAAEIFSGDIMVAVNGQRLQNQVQYELLRELSTGPTLKLIVWQRDRYREAEVRLNESRRLGVSIGTYTKR